MSEIKIYSSVEQTVTLEIYTETLQRYISKVLNKIHIDDKDIIWYICEEGDFPDSKKTKSKLKSLELLKGMIFHPRYGAAYVYNEDENTTKIFISTSAIRTAPSLIEEKVQSLFGQHDECLLIDVILDELAHAKTHKNHGDPQYEKELERYKRLYFEDFFHNFSIK